MRRKITVLAAVVIAALSMGTVPLGTLAASPANADVWFLGIGNDGYYRDVTGLRAAYENVPNPSNVPIHFRTLSNRSGSSIRSDLGWLADNAGPGDLAIFFYSGHGTTRYDYNRDENAGWATNSSDETIGQSYNWATDDQIANALEAVNPAVPVIAIFDSCYAGGMVGGRDDLNSLPNVFVMMSSRENQVSYGGYPYSRFARQLINGISTGLPADTDGDDIVTFDEWFDYADGRVYGQDPVRFDAGDYGSLPIIPEPATLVLLACGAVVTVCRRRRKAA